MRLSEEHFPSDGPSLAAFLFERYGGRESLEDLFGYSFRRSYERWRKGRNPAKRTLVKLWALLDGDYSMEERQSRVEEYARLLEDRGWIFSPGVKSEPTR